MKLSTPLQNLFRGIGLLLIIILAGTIGYRIIEGWSLIDSLFMTITTISTVGYGEVHPLSTAGRIFSIFLILGGVGAVFYILTMLVKHIVEGEFGIRIGRQSMESKIEKLHNHFILCGYDRVGEATANTLEQHKAKFVVIEITQVNADKARQAGFLTVQGDATKDEVLRRAGIDKAGALITALGDDADNTYTTLAARQLNPTIPIIARATNIEAQKKLQLAGAHRVVAPETSGGERMAMLALRPATVEFVETVLLGRGQELLIEEIEVNKDSPLVGSAIKQVEERFPGVRILAIRDKDRVLILNPNPNATIEKNSSLAAFGTTEQLQSIEGCCQSNEVTRKPTTKSRAN
jgi:voltage-gated potassium channel